MSKWHPIDTAPKDGTIVMGYTRGQWPTPFCPIKWSGWGGGVWDNATSGRHLSTDPTLWREMPREPRE